MDTISGFAWPVPRAFSAAVAACRFEQGDVLHASPAGYEDWPSDGVLPGEVLQVLDPPRSARSLPSDALGNRFAVNWQMPVTLDRHGPDRDSERFTTTQGRLFTALWRGDAAALDPDSPDPGPPEAQRELHKALAATVPVFRKRLARRARAGGHWLFLFATDDASDAARVKALSIAAVLADGFETETLALTPAEAGVPDADRLHPALLVRGVAIRSPDAASIESRLKGLLYAGAEGKTDRFSLSRHGHLEAL